MEICRLFLYLIEIAIFIIVFAHTGSAFLSIIMTETRKQEIHTEMTTDMKINMKLYDKCKYGEDAKVIKDVNITGIESLEVKEIPANEILSETDGSCVDDYNEYLILTYDNGETSTYRNSYVDVFRLH